MCKKSTGILKQLKNHLLPSFIVLLRISVALVGFPDGSVVKNPPANAGDAGGSVRSLGWEDLLGKGMAPHSSILSWTDKPGGL